MTIRFTLSGAPRTKKNSPRIMPILKGSSIPTLKAALSGTHKQAVMGLMTNVGYSLQPSEAYCDWFSKQYQLRSLIKSPAQWPGLLPFFDPVSVKALFYRDRDTGDLLGYLDGLADALQCDQWLCKTCRKKSYQHYCATCPQATMTQCRKGLEVIKDDNLIQSWDGSRLDIDRANPRIDVTVTLIKATFGGL